MPLKFLKPSYFNAWSELLWDAQGTQKGISSSGLFPEFQVQISHCILKFSIWCAVAASNSTGLKEDPSPNLSSIPVSAPELSDWHQSPDQYLDQNHYSFTPIPANICIKLVTKSCWCCLYNIKLVSFQALIVHLDCATINTSNTLPHISLWLKRGCNLSVVSAREQQYWDPLWNNLYGWMLFLYIS